MMFQRKSVIVAACALTVAVFGIGAAPAGAEAILTFGFTELNGDWDGVSSFFADDDGSTAGDVTLLLPVAQTASYSPGYAPGTAGYEMTMTLSNITPVSAEASGSLTVTDADGDTITADLTGFWIRNGIFGFFNGLLSDVMLKTGDGIFEGPSGGAFSMDFSGYGNEPFDGAVMTLTTGQWFSLGQGYQNQSTLVQASVVPEPASVALAVAGLLIRRTYRRRA